MEKLNMNMTQFKTAICNIAKKLKNEKVNYIVTLSKGGLVPSRYLAKHLKVDEIYCVGVKFYTGEGETTKKPEIYQNIIKQFNKDDVVLIVDDIVDSGESISVAMKEVVKHGTKNIITCAIYYKPKSNYKPDYYYQKVDDKIWVSFDWE